MERNRIVCEPHPESQSLVLLLGGNLDESMIPELDREISDAKGLPARVSIDLSEVTLVDRMAVKYLTDRAEEGIELVNCPHYLSRWFRSGVFPAVPSKPAAW